MGWKKFGRALGGAALGGVLGIPGGVYGAVEAMGGDGLQAVDQQFAGGKGILPGIKDTGKDVWGMVSNSSLGGPGQVSMRAPEGDPKKDNTVEATNKWINMMADRESTGTGNPFQIGQAGGFQTGQAGGFKPGGAGGFQVGQSGGFKPGKAGGFNVRRRF